MAKNLTPNQKRCEDCPYLITKNGQWACDECFGQLIEEIDDCPEGVTLEQIEEIERKTKENKVNVGARADKPKKGSKPRTVVVSDEKVALFDLLWEGLSNFYGENAEIVKNNKLISVKIGEKTFKIDIIEQRKPKN